MQSMFLIGEEDADDSTIADCAEAGGFFLVSKDSDFLHLRAPRRFSLLWLRCGNVGKRLLLDWLDARWERVEELLAAGEEFIELS